MFLGVVDGRRARSLRMFVARDGRIGDGRLGIAAAEKLR